MLHFNLAENYVEDEKDECDQLPRERSTSDGRVVCKPQESQRSELTFFSLLANQALASLDPSKRTSSSGNTGNGVGDGKDVSSWHENEPPHLPTMVEEFQEMNEPNWHASDVNAPYFIRPSTSQDRSESTGNVLGPYQCPVCGGRYINLASHMRMHSTDEQVCSVCKKAFRGAGYLKNHMMKEHPGETAETSADCGSGLETSTKHAATDEKENSHSCTDSGSMFAHTDKLKAHTPVDGGGSVEKELDEGPGGYKESFSGNVTSSGLSGCGDDKLDGVAEMTRDAPVDDRPQCSVCGRRFVCQRSLNKHMTIHTGEKPYKCSFCNKKYRDCHQLTLHELGHKGLLPQCNVCGGRYVKLSAHMLTHSTDNFVHVCSICNKAFRLAGRLRKHMLTHSGERPYTCADCGGLFRCSSHLKTHMLTHTKVKNHVCSVCGKTFAQNVQLKTHMRRHGGEKTYCCETCGKAFMLQSGLARHRTIHTSEKPFSCGTCGKQFRADTALWRHKMIHSGEQPYECSVCGMKFNQSCSMKRHMLVHTGEKPYSCSDCGERFTQSGGLASHRRRHCHVIKNQ